jgi:hypothetical protein
LCDLRSQFGWTRVTSGQLEIASSTSDADQTTNRIYAIKQGTSTASSGFDRVIRIDPVVVPIEGSTDADGQRINSTITTRAYTDGDPAQKRRYRHTLLTYDVSPGLSTYPNATTYPSAFLYPGASNGAFVVNVTKGLDATGGSSTIGSITPTSTSAGVSRFDHQSLSQAVTYTISTAGFPTSFSMFEVTNGFNQLRPGRVV